MSLLSEIQNATTDSNTELPMLLRKCKVLAVSLGNPEFKQWVENELNGYGDIKSLPDYRILNVNSKGSFSGPLQHEQRDLNIPLGCIDKKFHKIYVTHI